jgi:hypothetical protein
LVSLHALFTLQNQVFDAAIEGRWDNRDDTLLLVQRSGTGYDAVLQSKSDPSDKAKYEVHLVDINGVRFADLLPDDQIGHMILKVQTADGRLRVSFFDSEWLRQQATHEEADAGGGKKQAVLTQSTVQLRALVAKQAGESKAYDKNDIIFERAK